MQLIFKMAIFVLAGAVFGWFSLPLTEKIIAYKLRKRNKEVSTYPWRTEERMISILVAVLLSASAGYCFPAVQSVLICGFFFIAMIGTLVDFRIRIIPNELVLLFFLTGIPFNLAEGGIGQLATSVISCLCTFALFLLTARITYCFVKSIGVGAGDVKLASAVAFSVGTSRLSWFYIGIAVSLLAYISIGFYLKKIKIGSTFPMGGQIMAGCVAAFLLPELMSRI